MTGRFLAFEGCDACGKTTQARILAARLGERALLTRQPGGTAIGQRVRPLILDHTGEGAAMTARTEALLYAADRAQHVAEVIRPALAEGRTVVCDRYIASSLAYQGVGRGLGVDAVRDISVWATEGLWPEVTVLLRIPVDLALERLAASGQADRLEAEGANLFAAVAAAYDALAETEPGWRVVDGVGTVEEVAARVAAALDDVLCGGPGERCR